MTQQMRENLRDALMDGDPPALREIVEKLVTSDIDAIEPFVDDWLAQAEMRGRFAGMLELLGAQKERRKDIAASVPF